MKHAGLRDKEVTMQSNKYIRTLLVLGAFWALFMIYTPI
jgi:hypothetical protein